MHKPVRLRDFIEDEDGWLYAVCAYDNEDRVGCILRYIPHQEGERRHPSGKRYKKLDFSEAYRLIDKVKPHYSGFIHRVPSNDVVRVYKPEEVVRDVIARDSKIGSLAKILSLEEGDFGCTGSLLCNLESESSDIDLVVYGRHWFRAQRRLEDAVRSGLIHRMSDEMWARIYEKRKPAIPLAEFIVHERRKWNRGQIDGTYFDLLFTRDYPEIDSSPCGKGLVLGSCEIEAYVTDADLAFDYPSVYRVDHGQISRVLSFTHTYAGQVKTGEILQARGVCEVHNDERWLIVGTSREAPGEYIRSISLIEEEPGSV